MISDRVGRGPFVLPFVGVAASCLAAAMQDVPRPPTVVSTFEGRAGSAPVGWPIPADDLGSVAATPMVGRYADPAPGSGYPPYPTHWPPEQAIAAYDPARHRLRSVLGQAVVHRYTDGSRIELAVESVVAADYRRWSRLELGPAGTQVELEYREVSSHARLGELVVRTTTGVTETLHVCGVGPSQHPSCIAFVMRSASSRLRVAITSDGVASVRGWEGSLPVHRRFQIVFP